MKDQLLNLYANSLEKTKFNTFKKILNHMEEEQLKRRIIEKFPNKAPLSTYDSDGTLTFLYNDDMNYFMKTIMHLDIRTVDELSYTFNSINNETLNESNTTKTRLFRSYLGNFSLHLLTCGLDIDQIKDIADRTVRKRRDVESWGSYICDNELELGEPSCIKTIFLKKNLPLLFKKEVICTELVKISIKLIKKNNDCINMGAQKSVYIRDFTSFDNIIHAMQYNDLIGTAVGTPFCPTEMTKYAGLIDFCTCFM